MRRVVLVLLCCGLAAACDSAPPDLRQPPKKGTILFPKTGEVFQEQLPRVKVVRVLKGNWTPELTATATVASFRGKVRSTAQGRVVRLLVEQGEEIMAGQVMIELAANRSLSEINGITHIRSRISGRIVELSVAADEEVERGKIVAVVEDSSKLEANLFLSRRNYSIVAKAKEAELKLEDLPGEVFLGKIDTISKNLKGSSGKIAVKILLAYSGEKIRPGMSAKVVIQGELLKGVKLLPVDTLMQDKNGKYVYQLINGKITRKPVSIRYSSHGITVVRNGLEKGALVVINPSEELGPGMRVVPSIAQ
ncbi:MAG: efflux RND transporter periplasmic adaptor subunit [bacterium]